MNSILTCYVSVRINDNFVAVIIQYATLFPSHYLTKNRLEIYIHVTTCTYLVYAIME